MQIIKLYDLSAMPQGTVDAIIEAAHLVSSLNTITSRNMVSLIISNNKSRNFDKFDMFYSLIESY